MNQVPFTSHLEMWSPSPSISNFSAITPTAVYTRLYHHEPVFYPSDCILCGLPHTRMAVSTVGLPAISTPAPSPPRRRSRTIHRKQKKYISVIRFALQKFVRICSMALKVPLTKRHVYPIKRAECQPNIQTRS